MKIIYSVFIFCIVLFIYLHIQFHLKTGDDLEIYELEQFSKSKLEEICDVRQPVLFYCDSIYPIVENITKEKCNENYPAFEVKIRNTNDTNNTDLNSELFIPLPLHATVKLCNDDKTSSYFSENNGDFLKETGLLKIMKTNDELLRPSMVANCQYDLIFGSENTFTPFRYELNYRNFFVLTSGSATIQLSPPKYSKYLSPIKDYENFEFKSLINPWDVQPEYKDQFSKIKCLEFTMIFGQVIFIPAFWWYSIKLSKDTSIASFKYRTYMNTVAIMPNLAMNILQLQNIKRNNVKKINIKELNTQELNKQNFNININEINTHELNNEKADKNIIEIKE